MNIEKRKKPAGQPRLGEEGEPSRRVHIGNLPWWSNPYWMVQKYGRHYGPFGIRPIMAAAGKSGEKFTGAILLDFPTVAAAQRLVEDAILQPFKGPSMVKKQAPELSIRFADPRAGGRSRSFEMDLDSEASNGAATAFDDDDGDAHFEAIQRKYLGNSGSYEFRDRAPHETRYSRAGPPKPPPRPRLLARLLAEEEKLDGKTYEVVVDITTAHDAELNEAERSDGHLEAAGQVAHDPVEPSQTPELILHTIATSDGESADAERLDGQLETAGKDNPDGLEASTRPSCESEGSSELHSVFSFSEPAIGTESMVGLTTPQSSPITTTTSAPTPDSNLASELPPFLSGLTLTPDGYYIPTKRPLPSFTSLTKPHSSKSDTSSLSSTSDAQVSSTQWRQRVEHELSPNAHWRKILHFDYDGPMKARAVRQHIQKKLKLRPKKCFNFRDPKLGNALNTGAIIWRTEDEAREGYEKLQNLLLSNHPVKISLVDRRPKEWPTRESS